MFSDRIVGSLAGGSAIRAMFEQGNILKKKYGAENVYDFALGNPDPEPPQSVIEDLKRYASEPGIHKYMANAGYPEDKIFRPASWNAFGMDKEGADYRACATYGPIYK